MEKISSYLYNDKELADRLARLNGMLICTQLFEYFIYEDAESKPFVYSKCIHIGTTLNDINFSTIWDEEVKNLKYIGSFINNISVKYINAKTYEVCDFFHKFKPPAIYEKYMN